MKKLILILFLLCILCNVQAFAGEADTTKVDHNWDSNLFFSTGYSSPGGLLGEIGCNFNDFIGAGFGVYTFQEWVTDKDEISIYYFGRLIMPTQIQELSVFLLLGSGGELSLFGGDSFLHIHLGCLYELNTWACIRPEIGLLRTDESSSALITSQNKKHVVEYYPEFRLSVEIELYRLF